ncbi:hypothetical protein LMG26858_06244 [Achromobacter anxifer]|uniref:Uncharacterized protein n=1 Tax=Achromobacter anxifer TaxID=1287737 RepID=A0A6S7EY67_9BURK|nr:hypothetical protein LMG26858_06244 [Achromobacter anxifer]
MACGGGRRGRAGRGRRPGALQAARRPLAGSAGPAPRQLPVPRQVSHRHPRRDLRGLPAGGLFVRHRRTARAASAAHPVPRNRSGLRAAPDGRSRPQLPLRPSTGRTAGRCLRRRAAPAGGIRHARGAAGLPRCDAALSPQRRHRDRRQCHPLRRHARGTAQRRHAPGLGRAQAAGACGACPVRRQGGRPAGAGRLRLRRPRPLRGRRRRGKRGRAQPAGPRGAHGALRRRRHRPPDDARTRFHADAAQPLCSGLGPGHR